MPAITSEIAYCPQCGRPRRADGVPCPDCHPNPAAPPPYPPSVHTPPTRRSLLDLLLDPRSIHWLLGSGGVLLAAGLVVWLASLGLFQNPLIVAAAMAVGTAGLLAAGWSTIRFTRHPLAGRALTLLACGVMPLNLWFYNSHNLLTLDGHLWLAGVVCCALYAASAWRLKDSLFVYVLSAGVAMTGLLMLADMHRFTEIAAPSTLLVVLGLIALHVERIFPTAAADDRQGGDHPFARERFGRAFFWSAQALLGGGLLMLLGAQLAGHFPLPFLHLVTPQVVTDPAQRWWALALVAAGTYAYVYSDLVVRRVGTYLYLAAGTLLWGEVLAIDLFHLSAQPAALIVALSLTALGANLLQFVLARKFLHDETRPHAPITIPGAHLAILNMIPVAFGAITYVRATHNLAYAIAMLIAAACCRVGAHLARGTSPRAAVANLYTSAAATLVGVSALLTTFGLHTLATQAPVLMLIPIGYLVASRARRDSSIAPALARVAQAAGGTLVAFTLLASARQHLPTLFGPGTRPASTVAHAILFAEAALFYALAAVLRGRTKNVYLATLAAGAALCQTLTLTAATTTTCTVAFAALGLTMLAATRLIGALRNPQRTERSPLVTATLRCANALTTLSFLSATLLTLSHLAFKTPDLTAVLQIGALSALSLLAAGLAGHPGWRRGYVTAAVAQAALAGVALQRLMHLSTWQNVEVFSVAAGLGLLVAGHLGWHREQNRQRRSDAVTTQLLLGSLLAGLPLAIAALAARVGSNISLPNELALVTVGILLAVTGYICRIRSTTLTGGGLLALQLAMMLVFLGVRAQLALGVYLTLGGAAVFATGLLLSIYRDRLATIPDRIKNHQGVFKVLGWR